jgi:hypothetical protein
MKPDQPALRVIQGGGQLHLWRDPTEVVEAAIPLARQLALMAEVVGPASRDVADELIALLEAPRRPKRVA